MRIASLRVPDFPLQALRRVAPELAEAPLAVAAGPSPRDLLIAVSAEAGELGLRRGMTAAQARHAAPAALIRTTPADIAAAAEEALVDAARCFSPRVQRRCAGDVLLDAAGLVPRWPSEERVASELLRACRRVGLEARVGIASTAGVARVAAASASRGDALLVPHGGERGFLAPLPIARLEPSPLLLAALGRWGVGAAGELARLPREEVALRLGTPGIELHRLAGGEEVVPFVPDPLREVLREAVLVEDAVVSLEPFLFLLRGALARIADRLELRGEGFAEARLELHLEGGRRHEVRIRLVAATREVPAVLAMARLQLEAERPGAPVEGLTLQVTPGRIRLSQGSLFGPPLPAPGKLAMTLTRLAALVGPARVGAPQSPDSHRPGAWALSPFAPPPVFEVREGGARAVGPVLRALRPPLRARVVTAGDRPIAARADGVGGSIVACAGPYRTAGEWWGESAFARDDYDVATSDGALLRLSFDHRGGAWTIEGIYD